MDFSLFRPIQRTSIDRSASKGVMLRTVAWIGLALCVSTAAVADDINEARLRMSQGLEGIRTTNAFTLDVTGEEIVGETSIPIRIVTVFRNTTVNGIQTGLLEQMSFRNNVMTHRIAADGTRIWAYDLAKKEYMSVAYQVDRGPASEIWLRQMILTLAKWSPREASFNARLMQDIFLTANISTAWNPWTGPGTVTLSDEDGYSKVVCTPGNHGLTNLSYLLTSTDEGYQLEGGKFWREEKMNSGTKTTEWDLKVYYDSIPADTDFTFTPPADAKARSVSLPQVGG